MGDHADDALDYALAEMCGDFDEIDYPDPTDLISLEGRVRRDTRQAMRNVTVSNRLYKVRSLKSGEAARVSIGEPVGIGPDGTVGPLNRSDVNFLGVARGSVDPNGNVLVEVKRDNPYNHPPSHYRPTDDPVVKAMRQRAHLSFDRLWQQGPFSRAEAYQWLAKELGIPEPRAHMGAMLDKDLLDQVIKVCDRFMGTSIAAADFPDDLDD